MLFDDNVNVIKLNDKEINKILDKDNNILWTKSIYTFTVRATNSVGYDEKTFSIKVKNNELV